MPPEEIDYGTLFGVEMEGSAPQPEGPEEGETQEGTEQVGVGGPESAAAETESQEEVPSEEKGTGEEAQYLMCLHAKSASVMSDSLGPYAWTVACQAPLSIGFSRQEH